MTRARIIGVGAYAPKRILTNADLEKLVDTNDEWIQQRSGIRERRIADETEATSDLALKAAAQALERANLVPEDIEFIAVGTTTPDMFFPTVGNIVQHRQSINILFSGTHQITEYTRLYHSVFFNIADHYRLSKISPEGAVALITKPGWRAPSRVASPQITSWLERDSA